MSDGDDGQIAPGRRRLHGMSVGAVCALAVIAVSVALFGRAPCSTADDGPDEAPEPLRVETGEIVAAAPTRTLATRRGNEVVAGAYRVTATAAASAAAQRTQVRARSVTVHVQHGRIFDEALAARLACDRVCGEMRATADRVHDEMYAALYTRAEGISQRDGVTWEQVLGIAMAAVTGESVANSLDVYDRFLLRVLAGLITVEGLQAIACDLTRDASFQDAREALGCNDAATDNDATTDNDAATNPFFDSVIQAAIDETFVAEYLTPERVREAERAAGVQEQPSTLVEVHALDAAGTELQTAGGVAGALGVFRLGNGARKLVRRVRNPAQMSRVVAAIPRALGATAQRFIRNRILGFIAGQAVERVSRLALKMLTRGWAPVGLAMLVVDVCREAWTTLSAAAENRGAAREDIARIHRDWANAVASSYRDAYAPAPGLSRSCAQAHMADYLERLCGPLTSPATWPCHAEYARTPEWAFVVPVLPRP